MAGAFRCIDPPLALPKHGLSETITEYARINAEANTHRDTDPSPSEADVLSGSPSRLSVAGVSRARCADISYDEGLQSPLAVAFKRLLRE